ncbi:cell division protein FtsL [Shouchella miscanthi]|uniref:Cell division protein FtsL n=1 Tax=Shouchella miscanthi TaxID=2598861 RepID=A0ABU6NGP4_9BACI|nr:cell division protein FtsL [Shouchella miscanthi]
MLARQSYTQPQERPMQKEKQVIRYRARITLGEKVIAPFLAIVLFAVLCLIVHNYSSLYGLSTSVQTEQIKVNEITVENDGLKTILAEESAPENVMRRAKEQGMN